MSYNRIILEGKLGQDPEIRTTKSGESFATFSLATSESWKDKSGQKQGKTEWHNCIAWKGTATIIERYTSKGSNVLIEGKLSYNDFMDANGCKKKIANVIVGSIILLGKGQKSDEQEAEAEPEPQEQEQPSEPKKKVGRPPKSQLGDDDSEMPF